ncbi:hypothetical protein [Streptomyces sp. NBC_01446]|uniref:Transposase family protein n=1 Tax=Streptomyces sp. NBC_00119 TaxID=2975659 RepID=A0AAU1U122_9ACTN|nr:hypothetical protein [Streptomyces sp. NBC_01446]
MRTDAPLWDSLVFDGIDDVDVEAVTVAFNMVEVVARGRPKCPDCARFSDRVHDRYHRRLKKLPLAEQSFGIRLAFNQWRVTAEHRPLGEIMQVRQIYTASAKVRRAYNHQPQVEPKSADEVLP